MINHSEHAPDCKFTNNVDDADTINNVDDAERKRKGRKRESQMRWKLSLANFPEKQKKYKEAKKAAEKRRRQKKAADKKVEKAQLHRLREEEHQKNVKVYLKREQTFRENVVKNMHREKELRDEAILHEMLRTLKETKKFENLQLPNEALKELEGLRPAEVHGSFITGFYVTYKLDAKAYTTLHRILETALPVMRLAEMYFSEIFGWKMGVGMRGSIWMDGAYNEQLVHADSIFAQYIAIIIHVNAAWGTRFCYPETWGPDLPLTREELLDINWSNVAELDTVKYPQLKSQINEKLGKLVSEAPSYFTDRTMPAVWKPAGAVTMFLADVLHYGPAAEPPADRATIFTTLRPACEVHHDSDETQWNPVQTYYFNGQGHTNKDKQFREMRNRWEDAGYDLSVVIPREGRSVPGNARKARDVAYEKAGLLPMKQQRTEKAANARGRTANANGKTSDSKGKAEDAIVCPDLSAEVSVSYA